MTQHPNQLQYQPGSAVDAAEAIFVKALELRNFEISQLAQRNNFFMVFQGVLLAGVLQSAGTIPVVSFLACLAGLLASVFQTCMAAGAKYWQERWEYGVERAEKILLREIGGDASRKLMVRMFQENTISLKRRMLVRFLQKGRYSPITRLIVLKPSVSRIPIYMGVALSAVWLLLLLCTIRGPGVLGVPDWIVGFATKASV